MMRGKFREIRNNYDEADQMWWKVKDTEAQRNLKRLKDMKGDDQMAWIYNKREILIVEYEKLKEAERYQSYSSHSPKV